MQSNYSDNTFEKYAGDVTVHCRTEPEAIELKTKISQRMEHSGLKLHPEKTKMSTARMPTVNGGRFLLLTRPIQQACQKQ